MIHRAEERQALLHCTRWPAVLHRVPVPVTIARKLGGLHGRMEMGRGRGPVPVTVAAGELGGL